MADRDIATFGLFPDQSTLERAVEALRQGGFRNSDVSVLMAETPGNKALGHEAHSKAPEGATAGASAGAVVGGVLGWLIGIGALAIPGIGAFIAAGPIVAALAGVGAAGAAGGIIGALVGFGMPEYEAKQYEGRLRRGHLLVSVHSDDSKWARKAAEILESHGAQDIGSTAESHADYHV